MVKGKKITKRQLREPDEFITLTERAFIYFRQHSKKITIGGVVILALILAIVLFQMSERKREEEAARLFGIALETYETGVAQARDESSLGFKEALAKFDEVLTKFPRTSSGELPRLYEGTIHLKQDEYEDAIKAYTSFLEDTGKEGLYQYLAWEGLGHAYEGKKEYSKAFEAYQKIVGTGKGYQSAEAHLNIGNCYEKLGKTKEALENFKAFLSDNQKSHLTDVVLRKISILERQ